MTDTEIIKALECCTTKGAKCSDCPAFKKVDRSDCKKYFRGAIDLINSQKAYTERHAHWIEDKDITQLEITCNCCGYSYIEADPDCEERYDFCPHCGCKMDLEEVEQLKNN